jgi:hypothetical protein
MWRPDGDDPMTGPVPRFEAGPDPRGAADLLADWGFLANPDLPDKPGPGYLLVALRDAPTLRHYDPESVEFWASRDGRGARVELTRTSPMPLDATFAWGQVRIVDRLGVSNEWLTFGGSVSAALVDDMIAVVLVSPAPLLRRGGHSQGWDQGADSLGAFFGRLMVAVDYAPGFEGLAAAATPLARYAAFLADLSARLERSPDLRTTEPALWHLIDHEARRLQHDHPEDWTAGVALLDAAGLGRRA